MTKLLGLTLWTTPTGENVEPQTVICGVTFGLILAAFVWLWMRKER